MTFGPRIYVDVEARGRVDLGDVGSYRYCEDAETVPLCIGWKVAGDEAAPRLWWAGDPIPEEWKHPGAVFVSHGTFDRIFFQYKILKTRIEQWSNTMARGLYHGLPAKLEEVSSFLFNAHKDKRGEDLVKSTTGKGVCRWQVVTKGRGKNKTVTEYWNNDPDDLRACGEYCQQDVSLLEMLDRTIPELPPAEFLAYHMTERMNDFGLRVDYDLAAGAVEIVEAELKKLEDAVTKATDGAITAVTQTQRIPEWVTAQGVGMPNCQDDTVKELLTKDLPPNVRLVLEARALGSAAAVGKYQAILKRACRGNRIHGEMVFYGAHTGRYSSRGVQLQNPRRGKEKFYLGYCAAAKRRAPGDMAGWVDWGWHLGTAVRSAFIADPGNVMIASDYAGIEARVVSWLVDDEEDLQRFRDKIDGYVILAGSIYGVDPSTIVKGDDRRSVGKEARLSGQYGVGWKTYKKRLVKTWGVDCSDADAKIAIDTFRRDFWRIKKAWKDIENAWRTACAGIKSYAVKCSFEAVNGWMVITAPNGRSLYYWDPQAGKEISYKSPSRLKNEKQWVFNEYGLPEQTTVKVPVTKHTYGGALLENIAQWVAGMIAKDDMVEIQNLMAALGIPHEWLFMVHDESVSQVPEEYKERALEIIESVMIAEKSWAPRLPLGVESAFLKQYRKV